MVPPTHTGHLRVFVCVCVSSLLTVVTAGLADPDQGCIKLNYFASLSLVFLSDLQYFCYCVFDFAPFEASAQRT